MRRARAGRRLLLIALCAAIAWVVLAHSTPLLRHPIAALLLIRAEAPQQLPVPVRGVRRSQLRNTWGAPRSGGRAHQGIDIFAPRGREIVSTTRGLVVTVGQNALGGRIVRVLGPGGHWHYYAHLEQFGPIAEGELIAEGTVLGTVGDSGNARGTPPHLHYGIYRFRGGALNPFVFLSPTGR
ncbi:MAG TPA: M23 family metallopeptidase [Thermoanaerobaculia bacterium]